MKLFSIYNDRSSFWQWDTGQKLIVDDSVCQEVHFDNGTTDCALVCAVYEQDGKRLVNVPNILLQTASTLYAYAFLEDDDGERTKCSKCFNVYPRPKPADYVYTETEVWTAEKAVAEALEEAKASGAFKGDKGEPGVVKFIPVTELPTIGEEGAIYLLPNQSAGDNRYDEYLYTNGKWEKIGDTAVEINIDEFVKVTDYASNKRAGLVRIYNSQGLQVSSSNGLLSTKMATGAEINGKAHKYSVITPANLDYAVKSGLADSRFTWADTEKDNARQKIGAVGHTDYATNNKPGIVQVWNSRGISVDTNGIIGINRATTTDIDNKSDQFKPITPKMVDHAVKRGLVDNRGGAMSDNEKKKSCAWLGTIMVKENDDDTITVTLPSGRSKTVDLSLIEILL